MSSQPSMNVKECNLHIGSLKIKFNGGARYMINDMLQLHYTYLKKRKAMASCFFDTLKDTKKCCISVFQVRDTTSIPGTFTPNNTAPGELPGARYMIYTIVGVHTDRYIKNDICIWTCFENQSIEAELKKSKVWQNNFSHKYFIYIYFIVKKDQSFVFITLSLAGCITYSPRQQQRTLKANYKIM